MKKNKIKEQIEAEKDLLKAYLQTAEKWGIAPEEAEQQINFILEKIFELMQKLTKIN